MARIVMKFGGTSLEGAVRLRGAAEKIAAARAHGHQVVAVLSARGKETDLLVAQARALHPAPAPRVLDQLLATGELQSICLCATALQALGCPACTLSGAQAGILTDSAFGNAKIQKIEPLRILQAWARDEAVLVAGFQGISPEGDVTTLGRGGSDTTAVALACALRAEVCRIYTDVDGVYDRDPNQFPDAKKYARISYADMLALIDGGAQVLHRPCVEIASAHGLTVEVLSSLSDAPGTLVAG